MPKPLTPSDLPEDVARLAKAQLAAGRFASVEEFLCACGGALVQRDAAARYPLVDDEAAFIAGVREGLADAARGDLVSHEEVVAETERLIATIEARRPQ
jgi:predicted transcriptional regulator